ncbi:hypothetical protein CBL_21377 [Carabus blaptoides fortunei]
METALSDKLNSLGLDIKDCRGQSYDNASNISGIYSEIQQKKKQASNNLAEYVPCAALNLLNLVGSCVAEHCLQATSFFILSNELGKRQKSYGELEERFGFLNKPEYLENDVIRPKAIQLQNVYNNDLEDNFAEECVQHKYFITHDVDKEIKTNAREKLENIRKNNLIPTYPNLDIALQIFLCIPATNCSGERSFSTLKRIKNYYREYLKKDTVGIIPLGDYRMRDIQSKSPIQWLINEEIIRGIRIEHAGHGKESILAGY